MYEDVTYTQTIDSQGVVQRACTYVGGAEEFSGVLEVYAGLWFDMNEIHLLCVVSVCGMRTRDRWLGRMFAAELRYRLRSVSLGAETTKMSLSRFRDGIHAQRGICCYHILGVLNHSNRAGVAAHKG